MNDNFLKRIEKMFTVDNVEDLSAPCFSGYAERTITDGIADQIKHLNSTIVDFSMEINDKNFKRIVESVDLLKESYNNLKILRGQKTL